MLVFIYRTLSSNTLWVTVICDVGFSGRTQLLMNGNEFVCHRGSAAVLKNGVVDIALNM